MTTHKEALKLALEALDQLTNVADTFSVSGVYLNEEVWAKKCLSDAYFAITTIKEALAQPEQEHEVLGFNGWGFPIEKPNKALIEKTADHDVDCLCIDCSMVDEQDDVPWTDKAFERLCENWNNMTSAEFAIVQRFLFGVYAHPPVPTAQPKEPEQEPVAMKFKIYKPTVPDPTRQDINNALLPWVYDQDRSSGFDASMWVTPVATLPPQRKPLSEAQLEKGRDQTFSINNPFCPCDSKTFRKVARWVEAAHDIKE